jgi:hypothetical protein
MFTAHIVQKHFVQTVVVLLEALRLFIKSAKVHEKAITVLVEAVRVLV